VAHDPDLVASLWEEYQPRIEAARKAERDQGDKVFLDLEEERIGKFPAVHLTAEKYLLLDQVGCLDGMITRDSLKRFLWIVSPHFRPSWWAGKWFMLRHWRIKADLIPEVEKYMARTFASMPSGKSKGSMGGVSSLVDLLASEYSWKEKEILTCPLRRVFQYVASITSRVTGQDASFCSRADELQAEFMEKANKGD